MTSQPAVCNTTPLLYLGRISQVGWVPELYQPFHVPQAVVFGLDVGRSMRGDRPMSIVWWVNNTFKEKNTPWRRSRSPTRCKAPRRCLLENLPSSYLMRGEFQNNVPKMRRLGQLIGDFIVGMLF